MHAQSLQRGTLFNGEGGDLVGRALAENPVRARVAACALTAGLSIDRQVPRITQPASMHVLVRSLRGLAGKERQIELDKVLFEAMGMYTKGAKLRPPECQLLPRHALFTQARTC